MTTSNESLTQEYMREGDIQAHLNIARGLGLERAKNDTTATRSKEAFIENLMLANAEAQDHHELAARLRGEAVELEPLEERAFGMLASVKQIMATEDRTRKKAAPVVRYKVYKSPPGQDSSEAAVLAADLLGLNQEDTVKTERKIGGDILEEKAFISPWQIHYEYEGRLARAMDNFLINKKVAENTAKPKIRQAIENYDPEEVAYLLEGPQPLWTYEIAARSGSLDDLIVHNGLLKAIEEKAYRDSMGATPRSVRLVERRTIDKKAHDLKKQEYFLEIG
ncbi:hypothetical protein BVY00_02035 [bacterium G20]|nr:hypothetical protein BVY00_02035 [bacterium G20]